MKELGDDERSNKAGGGLFRVNVATTYLQFLQLNELVLLTLPTTKAKQSCVEIHYRVQ